MLGHWCLLSFTRVQWKDRVRIDEALPLVLHTDIHLLTELIAIHHFCKLRYVLLMHSYGLSLRTPFAHAGQDRRSGAAVWLWSGIEVCYWFWLVFPATWGLVSKRWKLSLVRGTDRCSSEPNSVLRVPHGLSVGHLFSTENGNQKSRNEYGKNKIDFAFIFLILLLTLIIPRFAFFPGVVSLIPFLFSGRLLIHRLIRSFGGSSRLMQEYSPSHTGC